ncbi:hypothetical protein CTAYLR_000508 [Chrysophaeum taylorii]|uniref:Uncharacterized protein n=1 Tax=Chrysophaeum taylorii TaxID=2483200 RepID=A0AAD7UGW6_9STRA|nr:hypothetical protein CTAYLR_000508 [Chrysophaeum taylorii]
MWLLFAVAAPVVTRAWVCGSSSSSSSSSCPAASSRGAVRLQAVEPSVPVAINGGDPWVGWRVTAEELEELADAATATIKGRPVMKQFHPRRSWLWRQWHGTIVRSVLQREVKLNVMIAAVAVASLSPCSEALKPVENLWALAQTLVAFVLSFFLSQTYAVWRSVYSVSRQVQGKLGDLGLIVATHAERDADGRYTPRAQALLDTWARYARLFNMLFYASVTRRFAPLATPKGLRALRRRGAILEDEVQLLIKTTSWHQTVAAWIGTMITSAAVDGTIVGGNPASYQCSAVMTRLRACYARMSDELSGRMPLAYTHLVQLFVDALCLAAPLALIGPLGPVGAVAGTGFVTLFYAGVLALAKMFLDPFDNEDFGGRSGIRLEADTLVQEVNALTRRWSTSAVRVPSAVLAPNLSEARVFRDNFDVAAAMRAIPSNNNVTNFDDALYDTHNLPTPNVTLRILKQ